MVCDLVEGTVGGNVTRQMYVLGMYVPTSVIVMIDDGHLVLLWVGEICCSAGSLSTDCLRDITKSDGGPNLASSYY